MRRSQITKDFKTTEAYKTHKCHKRLDSRRTASGQENRLATRNPFSPSFGTSPPVLAGRDVILDSVGDALAAGPTHPDFTALFIGVRGAGKTVMLNAVEDLARSRGWLALPDSASTAGLPDRLTRAASALLEEIGPAGPRRRLSSVTAAGIGVGFETVSAPQAGNDLRGVLSDLGDALAERGHRAVDHRRRNAEQRRRRDPRVRLGPSSTSRAASSDRSRSSAPPFPRSRTPCSPTTPSASCSAALATTSTD